MDNPVENYLREHQGVVFSRNKLKKRLGLTKPHINFFIKLAVQSEKIRRVDPQEVGCYKHNGALAIYTYTTSPTENL